MQYDLDNYDQVCFLLQALRGKGWAIVAYDPETLGEADTNRQEVEKLLCNTAAENWEIF